MSVVDFVLPAALEAHEPPEARGVARDGVRMLVAEGDAISHHRFTDLPEVLRPGDVLIVNTSGTLPAAVAVRDTPFAVHFSTELDDGRWLVEPRGATGRDLPLVGGARVHLDEPYAEGRLWVASIDPPPPLSVRDFLYAYGQPIRYGYVPDRWPLSAYQSVFATEPGSAEMPSASRPFTDRVVTRLVSRGVVFAPITLHTGVASAEAHERPYAERFRVPASSARLINQAAGRVIAIGTTAVRAVESAVGPDGRVVGKQGWTDLVITPSRGVRVVDGLLTGFHEPRASHLDMLAAIVDRRVLDRCYTEAIDAGYLWHEFGDVNLLIR
jgi:S-adenosylmethionine:tRNA ribosyltransferase-isomerase